MLQWYTYKTGQEEETEVKQSLSNLFFSFDCVSIMTTNGLPSTVPRKWYHTTLCNALIIGGVDFVAPGLWDALNALGSGGAEEPFLINAANALVFGLSKYNPHAVGRAPL